MCGRFALTLPHDAMSQLFAASIGENLMPTPRFNICPTQKIPTVVSSGHERHLVPMRWGFLPEWYKTDRDGPLLINARSETLAKKPAFRKACRARRCLIPVTGFYEWTKDAKGNRLPWYIHDEKQAVTALAGIWQKWTDEAGKTQSTCAIVTVGANEKMSEIHHRMPVSIASADYALWLGETGKGAARLMQAAPNDRFDFYRVDPRVNSNRVEDEALIMPFQD